MKRLGIILCLFAAPAAAQELTGTPLPSMGSGSYRGAYSKFRWAPYPNDASRGVFIMDCVQGSDGNYSASNVAIYKPNF